MLSRVLMQPHRRHYHDLSLFMNCYQESFVFYAVLLLCKGSTYLVINSAKHILRTGQRKFCFLTFPHIFGRIYKCKIYF